MKSDECYRGKHDQCDGCCLDSVSGCECECHFVETEDKTPPGTESRVSAKARRAGQGKGGMNMAAYRAAVEINGRFALVPARRHLYHADRLAALRALERVSRRSSVNARGFCWLISAGDVTTMDLAAGNIPIWVETVAL